MKTPDPFAEDRHIMSKEPMLDYSWVLHSWVPRGSRPDENGTGGFPFSTEWTSVVADQGPFIVFMVRVRATSGMFTVTTSQHEFLLETKAGKEAFKRQVRDELDKQIEARMGLEVKA